MSYGTGISSTTSAQRILGNPTSSPITSPQEISLVPPLAFNNGQIVATPAAGRVTTGNITLQRSDNATFLTSTDSGSVTYTLPAGLPSGFSAGSFQGGAGQITYSAGLGATVLNTTTPVNSKGNYSNGYYVVMQNLGNDSWIVTGNLA